MRFAKIRKQIKQWLKRSRTSYISGIPFEGISITSQAQMDVLMSGGKVDQRIQKKPVEVYEEIISDTKPDIDCTNLDEKIKMVKERILVLKRYLGRTEPVDENIALGFLNARKKLLKSKAKFDWQITTKDKIEDLCNKYKVKLVGFSGFYKSMPTEALTELDNFVEQYEKVSDEEPNIFLIIDDGGKEHKKDPILLVNSPFGNWYYVLGAWDKEIEIVDKLIYG